MKNCSDWLLCGLANFGLVILRFDDFGLVCTFDTFMLMLHMESA